jgi:hypothetical protein
MKLLAVWLLFTAWKNQNPAFILTAGMALVVAMFLARQDRDVPTNT